MDSYMPVKPHWTRPERAQPRGRPRDRGRRTDVRNVEPSYMRPVPHWEDRAAAARPRASGRREPWRSAPVLVENVCGGRRETRYQEIPPEEQSPATRRELAVLAARAAERRATKGGGPLYVRPLPPQ